MHHLHGFIEHGHLCGERALLVEVTCRPLNVDSILSAWERVERVHFFIPDNGMAGAIQAGRASDAAKALSAKGVHRVSACVRPGVFLPSDPLAYESVLRVTIADLDVLTKDDLDPRLGSVSVHFWSGSGALTMLASKMPAQHGLFLVMPPADLGAAKVWLNTAPQPRWKLIPAHPLNELESAEFDEMSAGTKP